MENVGPNMLAALGVDAREEEVYRLVLRSPGITAAAVARSCGLTDTTANAVLDRLRELGAVTATGPSAFRGTDPRSVVDRLTRRRLRRLHREARHVASSRHLADSLLEDQRAGDHAPTGELGFVEGLAQVVETVDDLSFFARQERLTTYPAPILAAALDDVRTRDLKYLRRGLRMRTLLPAGVLDRREVHRFATELRAQGAEVRSTARPLERMVVFDRRTAVVAADPHDPTRGALVVHHPGLVALLLDSFERHWARSVGLGEQLTDRTGRLVLHTMARVDKDETGARELGMSLRTYRGHIAALMRRLGTTNRFHTALAARDRNWI
ncbi:helix-turn-helix transcriptional regulator [Kitasatospora sp. NPDC018619]|uniref:helix-turn-helix transcriptional regulator n=1 Tax=unclassified Kitasatospora TaxID=2633591 RepID=UPI0037A3D293